jgi:DNA polymerase-3 subunit beta
VPADFTGDEPVIAFNPHYLLDGIAAAAVTGHARADTPMRDGTTIRLQFSSASKPAVITRGSSDGATPESDFRYLVVPQRVQS